MTTSAPEPTLVLVIDDEPAILRVWKAILREPQYRLITLDDPEAAISTMSKHPFDVAIVDVRMPKRDGMQVLSEIKTHHPEVEVVMMTGFGGVQEAVTAIRNGAYDFLTKPFESAEAAELTIRRAAELRRLERRVKQLESQVTNRNTPLLIGRSAHVIRCIELATMVAPSNATTLITGESGTGKELIARMIHQASQRNEKPLTAINCSALSESVLESELFGHAKGAFTGAATEYLGLFRATHQGTLFLDEIGDMALTTQVKLLRTLQEGEVRPVGSTQTHHVDVRIIAATHRDLNRRCEEGLFRRDLYYRLNVIQIALPPLRDRGDDILLLALHFLHQSCKALNKSIDGFEAETLELLKQYSWPGNVRELENAIERATILCQQRRISPDNLPDAIRTIPIAAPLNLTAIPFAEAKAHAVAHFERNYLTHLIRNSATISAAAKTAGLDRSNFRRLLRRYAIK